MIYNDKNTVYYGCHNNMNMIYSYAKMHSYVILNMRVTLIVCPYTVIVNINEVVCLIQYMRSNKK